MRTTPVIWGALGAMALVAGLAASPGQTRPADAGVVARTGFDLAAAWIPLEPGQDGLRRVRLPTELGRVELRTVDPITAAHMVVNQELRPLPLGSSVLGHIFAWAPPVGYIGAYRLRLVLGESAVDVEVTLAPMTRAPANASEIRMHLDAVTTTACGVRAGQCVTVTGWALDPQAAIGAGIDAVHVWARRGTEGPRFIGEAALGALRPDVADTAGPGFSRAGFTLAATVALPAGDYTVTAYVWNRRTSRWEDARSEPVRVR